MTVDYSQYGQQEVITRYFGNRTGFLGEVGANDGVLFSNSRYLLEHGWKGLLVEPNPTVFPELVDNCVGLPFAVPLRMALGDRTGTVTLNIPPPDVDGKGTTSTLFPNEGWERVEVPMHSLGEVFPVPIDLLLVDAEGCDLYVLKGVDWEVNRPEMVVVETNIVGFEAVYEYMNSVGYALYEHGKIDTFYIRKGVNV